MSTRLQTEDQHPEFVNEINEKAERKSTTIGGTEAPV